LIIREPRSPAWYKENNVQQSSKSLKKIFNFFVIAGTLNFISPNINSKPSVIVFRFIYLSRLSEYFYDLKSWKLTYVPNFKNKLTELAIPDYQVVIGTMDYYYYLLKLFLLF